MKKRRGLIEDGGAGVASARGVPRLRQAFFIFAKTRAAAASVSSITLSS